MFTVGCVGVLVVISLAWGHLTDRWLMRSSHQPIDLSHMVDHVGSRRGRS